MKITIKAPPSAIAEYHSLLMKEWTQGTLEKVLRLLCDEISDNGELGKLSFCDVLCPDGAARTLRGVHQEVVEQIAAFTGFFRVNGTIPAVPSPKSWAVERRNKLMARAETTWTYLVLHTFVDLRGEVGFFHDTQSLLFLTAVHYLLPALKEHGHMTEHDCAVNALFMHIHTAWSMGDQQEHAHYLRSALLDYLGDKPGAAESLRLSVALTPFDDESYLTQVQQYAFALLDSGRVRQSLEFLLATYRNAPEPYLDELKEIAMCIHGRGVVKAT
ncbi:MAG TPA: hypothetical protein VND64_20440 [Pirellulales bacterium]|nr:hypothetical protein [Pirellulales bacterium]